MSGAATRDKRSRSAAIVADIAPSRLFCNAIVEEDPQKPQSAKGAGIWLVDRDLRILWMNKALEEEYGPLESLQGVECYRAFRDRSTPCPDCLPTRAFKTGHIISGHVSRRGRDGTERHFQQIEAPLFDERNEVSRVLEIVLDTTERERIQEDLRRSEAEYRALFEHSGTAVVVSDERGMELKVNRAFEELSGFSAEEVEGKKHYLEFVDPRDRKRIETYDRARRKDPGLAPESYEFFFVNRNKERRLVHISVNTLPNGQQICALIDMTQSWKLEQEIRSKDQFLANILHHSVDAIVAMDTDEVIQSWNRGAETLFGFKADEVLGRRFSSLLLPSFVRSKAMTAYLARFRREGFVRDLTAEARTKDGSPLTISITRTSITQSDGRDVGSSAILRDLTASKRMEQRMLHEEKMLALGELAASLAHEVKNPLNSMVVNLEVLKSRLSDLPREGRDKIFSYINVLSSEVSRLDKVMRGVLDFSKPFESEFQRVDLSLILTSVVDLVAPQAKRAGIKVAVSAPPHLPQIEGAEDQLKQVFLNLLLNAFQAMPEGGRVRIRLSQGPNDAVTASVSDTGVGIPRSHYGRIFNLYFSTKEKGSGLGLALVKRLVTAHGGSIRFRSKMNHGTTFTITFPAA